MGAFAIPLWSTWPALALWSLEMPAFECLTIAFGVGWIVLTLLERPTIASPIVRGSDPVRDPARAPTTSGVAIEPPSYSGTLAAPEGTGRTGAAEWPVLGGLLRLQTQVAIPVRT